MKNLFLGSKICSKKLALLGLGSVLLSLPGFPAYPTRGRRPLGRQ